MEKCSRLLVVDDHEDTTEILALLLLRGGYDVEKAFSGCEALAKCETESFNVIISDIGMPGMNGYELARKLRARPCGNQTILIAMTGFDVHDDRKRATAAGFDALLRKPVSPDYLLKTIERLLSRK